MGRFVYHCHVLFHEDHGMMAAIQVDPCNGQDFCAPATDDNSGEHKVDWKTALALAIGLLGGTLCLCTVAAGFLFWRGKQSGGEQGTEMTPRAAAEV